MISHKTHAESLLDELDSLRRSEFVENEDHITKHNTSGLSTARRSQSSNKEVRRWNQMESIRVKCLFQFANYTVNSSL